MKKNICIIVIAAVSMILLSAYCTNAANSSSNPDTSSWFAYDLPTADDIAGTPLDASSLLDKPAGKHGYLTSTSENKFVFEDGTNIRFWGVNITAGACYPQYDVAVENAKRISECGFNIVRFHLVDSGSADGASGIWGAKTDDGRLLNKEAMDRLSFMINELKKRGVYCMIDIDTAFPLIADLPFHDIEKMRDGYKVHSYFDEAIIAAQEKYADEILGYRSAYTGLCLKDEPSLALVDLKNEDSLAGRDSATGNTYYDSEIKAKYNTWLAAKYTTRDALVSAWAMNSDESSKTVLGTDEDQTNGTVLLWGNTTTEDDNFTEARRTDRNRFYEYIQENYYNVFISHLRTFGLKCRITGATTNTMTGKERMTFSSNIGTDFIDSHHYVSNVTTTAYADGTVRSDIPSSQLSCADMSITGMMNLYNVYGMPHTITEWNDIAPNKYRSESLLLMSAYSALDGYSPFAFCWRSRSRDVLSITQNNALKTTFGFADSPEYISALPTAARIFLRGDVTEAASGFYPLRFRDDWKYTPASQWITGQRLNKKGIAGNIGLIGKTGMTFDEKAYSEDINDNTVMYLYKNAYSNNTPFLSQTGELSCDKTNDIFMMNTEKTQALSGLNAGKAYEFDDCIIAADNYFSTEYLTSIDDKAICSSTDLLLTVVGDSRQTGQVMSDDEKTITTAGTSPVLIEPITGTVTMKTTGDITVYPLTSSGKRSNAKAVTTTSEGYKSFVMAASDKAVNYEIIKRSGARNTHISLGDVSMPDLYTDVTSTNAYKKQIDRMTLTSCIGAKSGTIFSPEATATKRDLIKLIVDGLDLTQEVWVDTSSSPFEDLAVTGDGYNEMYIAYRLGVISRRSSGWLTKKYYIDPDTELTRGVAMEYTAKLLKSWPSFRKHAPDASYSLSTYSDYDTYKNDINIDNYRTILGLGYLDGVNGSIDPTGSITRAVATDMAYRIAWK